MSDLKAIAEYNKNLEKNSREICNYLLERLNAGLPKSEAEVWHGHPVWFIGDNPVAGYSQKKAGIELLFWSGQSFEEEELQAIGKYKAAGFIFENLDDIKKSVLDRWIQKSRKIQWDYANLPKNRELVRLTEF